MDKEKSPDNWKEMRLGEITTCLDGRRIPLNSEERQKIQGDIPYYGANGQLDSVNKHIFDEELLLLAEDGGSWGFNQICSYIIGGKSWVNNHAHVLRMNEGVNISYLMYFLNNHDLNKFISGTTRGKLNQRIMNKMPISLPPLPTQQKIVTILEKAEKLKEWRKEADALTDEFLKSVFNDMFGDSKKNPKNWPKYTLAELSTEIIDCPHSTPKYIDSITEFPCIRTTELKEGYINWTQMKYLDTNEYVKRIKRLKPLEGDIIYGREGSFGEAVRVPPDTKISLGQRVMLFRVNRKLCNDIFLWTLIRSDAIYHQALRKTNGSTVGHVNIKDIKKFDGICPPLKLQNKFASIVEKIEEMHNHQKQSKQQIDNLFNALMQNAFKGKLTA